MNKHILFALSALLAFSSCRMDDEFANEDYGEVSFSLTMDNSVIAVSRAFDENGDYVLTDKDIEDLKKKSKVRIYQDGKLVVKYPNFPSEPVVLPFGSYNVTVVAGDSTASPSRTPYFFKGSKEFKVEMGAEANVDITCNLANSMLDINFADGWENVVKSDIFSYSKVKASVANESLTYYNNGKETEPGYYVVPSENPVITCLFTGTSITGKAFQHEYLLKDVKQGYKYTLTYTPKQGDPVEGNDGGTFVDITVDKTPLYDVKEEVKLYQRPTISAMNGSEPIDLSQNMIVETGANISPVFTFSGSTPLASVVVESDLFAQIGFDKTSLDLVSEKETINKKGLGVTMSTDDKVVTLSWNDKLKDALAVADSKYTVNYVVTDTYNNIEEGNVSKTREASWTIVVSDANVSAVPVPDEFKYVVWSDKVVSLYGKKFEGKEPTGQLYFRYREKGTNEWSILVEAVWEDPYYKSVEIKGLKPGTTYEYQMMEGEKPSNVICEFTTYGAPQFPNAGFENWHQSGKTYYIYEEGGSMFWDSGNEGSTTGMAASFGSSMTTPATDYFHSGKSACLKTNVVMNVVAAGNLFIGDFLGTESLTKGILGWGRPWDSRPLALHGYVRYVPTKASSLEKLPEGKELPEGMDRGIIYIAVGDWAGASYNSDWPVVIRTLNPNTDLFNPATGTYTGDGIIAYGEKVFAGEVKGTDGGMVEFTIPLDYRSLERMPKSIIVVASASQYGDYYVGGKGSTMWLDDLELIYEESELEKLTK